MTVIKLPKDLTEEEYFYLLTLEFRRIQINYRLSGHKVMKSRKMAMEETGLDQKLLSPDLLELMEDKIRSLRKEIRDRRDEM